MTKTKKGCLLKEEPNTRDISNKPGTERTRTKVVSSTTVDRNDRLPRHRLKYQIFPAFRAKFPGRRTLQHLIPFYARISRQFFFTKTKRSSFNSLMKLAFFFVMFLFQMHLSSSQAQFIMGVRQNCSNEGEVVNIPQITDDPCITCYCAGGFVGCRQEDCSKPTCHVVKKERNQCCPTCDNCVVGNRTYLPSEGWFINDDSLSCAAHNCNNGIFTKSQIHCHVDCENPTPPPSGECCPSCRGCTVNGVRYYDGDRFSLPGDPCVKCTCIRGSVTCSKKLCPVIPCEREEAVLGADRCCLECVGIRQVFELDRGSCWFQRKILHDEERIEVDLCTSCTCKNGTVVCDRQTCPVTIKCPRSEWIYSPVHCCPMCPQDLLKNCTGMDGEKHKHGETWSKLHNPCRRCICNNGTVVCGQVRCPANPPVCLPGQILDSIPGRCCQNCVDEPGICAVFGDPHYRTFDGLPFNFQGDCKYMLAKDCLERNFTVVVQNDGKRSRQFSWTKTVFLRLFATENFPEVEISLHQRLIAKRNGRKMSLPYINRHVTVVIEQGFIKVRTARGVSLKWDGDSYLEVAASPQYRGYMCGLCGNFNGFSRDDFIGGDGLFKRDKISFAESWRHGNNNEDCTRPDYQLEAKEPCSRDLKEKVKAREKCSIFKSKPFYPCYNLVDPTEYYKSCLIDACECPRNRKCSCESIRAYTSACARRGVTITWDKKIYCKSTCRHGKVYSSCGPACKITCKNYKNTRRNKRCLRRPCVAGCHCPAGYVILKNRCVKTTSCPKRKPSISPSNQENPFTSILVRRVPLRELGDVK